MIVEVRSYRIRPGKCDEFIKMFETRAVPALRNYGMNVVGSFSRC
jgi:heme-degrading monooxygenase HmoA